MTIWIISMEAGKLSGPGLVLAQSRISRPDILDEATFLHWYDDDHIPEIVATSGFESAFRFKHVDPERALQPHLVIYPLRDLAFSESEEFKGISTHSKLLPGTGTCYDLVDFYIGYYSLIQVYDPTAKGAGLTKMLVVEQMDVDETTDKVELDTWYRQEYLPALSQIPGYLRTTRYKLKNAWPYSKAKVPHKHPAWLVLHEWETDSVNWELLDREISSVSTPCRQDIFHISKTRGPGTLFHGQDVVSPEL